MIISTQFFAGFLEQANIKQPVNDVECNQGIEDGSVVITLGRDMKDNEKGNTGDESKALRQCWRIRRCLISSFIQKIIVLKII